MRGSGYASATAILEITSLALGLATEPIRTTSSNSVVGYKSSGFYGMEFRRLPHTGISVPPPVAKLEVEWIDRLAHGEPLHNGILARQLRLTEDDRSASRCRTGKPATRQSLLVNCASCLSRKVWTPLNRQDHRIL
ncbi:hypothetical protein BD311DRAFT_347139 [Dichomitus squalens]|uniref:Uncharacterized protein n=1 Tax=Dichomitus squalens TaxID=114155 RepID=A0A4Q9N4N6_9APHY|nr:hypothetical protein BD311DRAFT_347139 [Dichomitus squalens]